MRWNHWGAHWRGRSSFDRASVTVLGVLDEELGPVAVKTGNQHCAGEIDRRWSAIASF
jgi:hypothetical protein